MDSDDHIATNIIKALLDLCELKASEILGFQYDSKSKHITLRLENTDVVVLFPALQDENKQWHRSHFLIPGKLAAIAQPPNLPDGEICHQVNEKCEDLIANRCHLCAGAWSEVTGDGCIRENTKICGNLECGNKGQVACVRGSLWAGKEEVCEDNSPSGFCAEGLSILCLDSVRLSCL